MRRLELEVTRRLDGLLHGDHLSLVPGHGSEPGDSRAYTPGDDVRRIDWNVTARTNEVHVRDTIAERELEVWLVADLSASLEFGTADCRKRDLAAASAAALGFLTSRGGNRLGALVVNSGNSATVPPRGGRAHLMGVLHRLVSEEIPDGGGPTDLGAALHRLTGIARRRSLVVVISDFLATPGWDRALGVLGTRHDLLAVEVIDPRELELPPVGMLDLVDPETGRHLEVPTSSRAPPPALHRGGGRPAPGHRHRASRQRGPTTCASAPTTTGWPTCWPTSSCAAAAPEPRRP